MASSFIFRPHPFPVSFGMNSVLRMIDANANRAREGLRVMEDVARFHLDDEGLCRRVKGLRHRLRVSLAESGIDNADLLLSRDTPGDVGTQVTTRSERERQGVRDIAIAACKRVGEALRVLEESVKTLERGSGEPAHLKALRYEAYEIERSLLLALESRLSPQWRLCVLISESLCKRPWDQVALAAMRGGADCLQLREKTLTDRVLVDRAKALVAMAREFAAQAKASPLPGPLPLGGGVSIIINDRVDVAIASGAQGVHLGQDDLDVMTCRRIAECAGRKLLIGVSTHDLTEAHAAEAVHADYCGVGAMFESATKERETSGVEYLKAYLADLRLASIPHLAIGGITPANVHELMAAGCRGIAVSSVVCGADDPEGVCRGLIAAMGKGSS